MFNAVTLAAISLVMTNATFLEYKWILDDFKVNPT